MKPTIAIIVFMLLLKPVLPVVSYIANYDYIVKELCENREKPQMQCNGKCHLMKELAKASEGEKPAHEKKVHTEAEILFCQALPLVSLTVTVPDFAGAAPVGYNNLYFYLGQSAILHPPAVA